MRLCIEYDKIDYIKIHSSVLSRLQAVSSVTMSDLSHRRRVKFDMLCVSIFPILIKIKFIYVRRMSGWENVLMHKILLFFKQLRRNHLIELKHIPF